MTITIKNGSPAPNWVMNQLLTHSPGIGFTSQYMCYTIPSVASTPKCSFFRNRSNIWY